MLFVFCWHKSKVAPFRSNKSWASCPNPKKCSPALVQKCCSKWKSPPVFPLRILAGVSLSILHSSEQSSSPFWFQNEICPCPVTLTRRLPFTIMVSVPSFLMVASLSSFGSNVQSKSWISSAETRTRTICFPYGSICTCSPSFITMIFVLIVLTIPILLSVWFWTHTPVFTDSQSYLLCESVHPFFPLWQFSFYFSHSYSLFYIIVFVQFSLNFLSCIHTFVQITWQKKSNYVKSILNITESSKNFAE